MFTSDVQFHVHGRFYERCSQKHLKIRCLRVMFSFTFQRSDDLWAMFKETFKDSMFTSDVQFHGLEV